jgi:hypothetical protein
MGVNQRFGIDESKTRRLGKIFNSIDFEVNENYNNADYLDSSLTAHCGSFFIDGREFKVNLNELKRIAETANSAVDVLRKKYKIGLLQR